MTDPDAPKKGKPRRLLKPRYVAGTAPSEYRLTITGIVSGIALIVAGIALFFVGRADDMSRELIRAGVVLVTASVVGYNHSRGSAKIGHYDPDDRPEQK